jgi:hypothetical protein
MAPKIIYSSPYTHRTVTLREIFEDAFPQDVIVSYECDENGQEINHRYHDYETGKEAPTRVVSTGFSSIDDIKYGRKGRFTQLSGSSRIPFYEKYDETGTRIIEDHVLSKGVYVTKTKYDADEKPVDVTYEYQGRELPAKPDVELYSKRGEMAAFLRVKDPENRDRIIFEVDADTSYYVDKGMCMNSFNALVLKGRSTYLLENEKRDENGRLVDVERRTFGTFADVFDDMKDVRNFPEVWDSLNLGA